jgi:hypothetical protein
MGLGAMIVVCVAWHMLTILGEGAFWDCMALLHKTESNIVIQVNFIQRLYLWKNY